MTKIAIFSPCMLCNNNCRICAGYSERPQEFVQPKLTDVLNDIKEFGKNGATYLWISGGEPTINKDFIKILEAAKDAGFEQITILTNGQALSNKEYLNNIIEAGANVFHVALHNHDPVIHEYITRTEGSFNKTIQGIKNIIEEKRKRITLTISHVMNTKNFIYLPNFAEFILSLKGVDACQFSYPFFEIASFTPDLLELMPKYSELKKYLHEAIKILEKGSVGISVEAVPPCFLIGFEHYYSDYHMKEDVLLRGYHSERGFAVKTKYRQRGEEMTYTKKCTICLYRSVCVGIYVSYLKKFGDSEFYPVKQLHKT